MIKALLGFIAFLCIAAGIVGAFSIFTVDQRENAMVMQFGKPDRIITKPGLHLKYPFVQNVLYFDKRILDLDAAPQEVIAADRDRLVVDAFVRYRIKDVLLFYKRVRDQRRADSRLSNILESALKQVIGKASFNDVVRDNRTNLMSQITKQVHEEASTLGLEVLDVRIKRADLPQQNSQAIYARMQTERQQEARNIRARGEEIALRIRAEADRKATVLEANAVRDGEIARGKGDAIRNKIFAEAFSKDPDFFGFYRAMQAYEKGLKSKDTRMVLSPKSDFFRYFIDPTGATR